MATPWHPTTRPAGKVDTVLAEVDAVLAEESLTRLAGSLQTLCQQ